MFVPVISEFIHTGVALGKRAEDGRNRDSAPRYIGPDVHWMPIRIVIAKGSIADCKQAELLMDGIGAKVFWRAVNSTRIREEII